MIKVAVVDDESHCRERIFSLLKPYLHKVQIFSYDNAENAVNGMNAEQPEIIFLDVQIQDKTGFDVLNALTYKDFTLIFVTAFEKYAIDAFRFSAIDYLLKPIDSEAFSNAFEKAYQNSEKLEISEQLSVLSNHINNSNDSLKKITIPTSDGYIFLKISEIIRCQSDINYTHLYSLNNKKITVSKSLKHYEELLTPYNFFRIHNSHLVNIDFIIKYQKSGTITLVDQTKLEVSQRRKEEFLKLIRL